jgi:dTDP-4-dehydrorhamnose reductase
MRVLVFGGRGMLGHAVYRTLSGNPDFDAFATLRDESGRQSFPEPLQAGLLTGVDANAIDVVMDVFARIRPDAVVNCVGLVKQRDPSKDPLGALPVNAIFPHRLARLCAVSGARLVHVSTDCVFSGRKGQYNEGDIPDAEDLYGRSKLLGEVDQPHAVTLRTSIIGRELTSRVGLVEWFLASRGRVRGFTNAIFSGLTTSELARVIAERVLPARDLHGVWHVSSSPIAKHALLVLLRDAFQSDTEIEPDPTLRIDRSLDSSRFRTATGYRAPEWTEMVEELRLQGA